MRADARNIKPHFGFCPAASGPDHGEPRRFFLARIRTMNRDWLVAQAFQPAGSGDFRVARLWSIGLESPVNRQAGKPALHSGSWKAIATLMPRIGTMNRERPNVGQASRL